MLNTLSAHGLKMAVLRQSALGLCLWVIPRGERKGHSCGTLYSRGSNNSTRLTWGLFVLFLIPEGSYLGDIFHSKISQHILKKLA